MQDESRTFSFLFTSLTDKNVVLQTYQHHIEDETVRKTKEIVLHSGEINENVNVHFTMTSLSGYLVGASDSSLIFSKHGKELAYMELNATCFILNKLYSIKSSDDILAHLIDPVKLSSKLLLICLVQTNLGYLN